MAVGECGDQLSIDNIKKTRETTWSDSVDCAVPVWSSAVSRQMEVASLGKHRRHQNGQNQAAAAAQLATDPAKPPGDLPWIFAVCGKPNRRPRGDDG